MRNASALVISDLNALHADHTFRLVYTDSGKTRASAALAMQRAAIDYGAHAMVGDFSSRYVHRLIFEIIRS
jgi:hypothetical protein